MTTKRKPLPALFTSAPPDHLFYRRVATPFGSALAFWDEKDALCCLYFLRENRTEADGLQNVRAKWKHCLVAPGKKDLPVWLPTLFDMPSELCLRLSGTPFQLKVWQALLDIPKGQTESYGALAKRIGKPKAARAIGGAVGSNPLPYFVPCHRILAADGSIGGYSGGLALKRAMLKKELEIVP